MRVTTSWVESLDTGTRCLSSFCYHTYRQHGCWFARRFSLIDLRFSWTKSFITSIGGEGRPPNIWWQGREHRGELGPAGDHGHRDEGAAAVHQRVQDSSQLDQFAVPVEGNGYRDEHRRQGEHRLSFLGGEGRFLFCSSMFWFCTTRWNIRSLRPTYGKKHTFVTDVKHALVTGVVVAM